MGADNPCDVDGALHLHPESRAECLSAVGRHHVPGPDGEDGPSATVDDRRHHAAIGPVPADQFVVEPDPPGSALFRLALQQRLEAELGVVAGQARAVGGVSLGQRVKPSHEEVSRSHRQVGNTEIE